MLDYNALLEINVVSWRQEWKHTGGTAPLQGDNGIYSSCTKKDIYIKIVLGGTQSGKERKLYMSGMKHTELSLTLATGLIVQWIHPKPHCSSVVSHRVL